MAKKRVSLTLEEELVDRIDSEADREQVNRSQMVEEILTSYFRQKSVDTAVVLCGDPEARSLKYFEGKPVLEHLLDHLSEEGVSRAILLIGNNSEIEERFGSNYRGLALDYIVESNPEGAAAALRNAGDMVENTFVLLNGHVISDVDIQEMTEAHREEGSTATMALTTVEDPSKYGVARLKGSKILGFEEKPEPGEEPSRLINAGTYIVEPEIFNHLDDRDLEQVFEHLAEELELSGYIYGGKWKDIDED